MKKFSFQWKGEKTEQNKRITQTFIVVQGKEFTFQKRK